MQTFRGRELRNFAGAKDWKGTLITFDEAVMDNPVGGIKRGWEQIRSVSSGKYRFEFYHYSYHEAGHVFYVVGRERGEYRAGEVVLHMGIRTSEVFRRIDGEWRQIHHHGYRGFIAVSCIRVPPRLEIVLS